MHLHDFIQSWWDLEDWFGPTNSFHSSEVEDEFYTDYQDAFLYPIPLTIGILIVRYLLEKYCFCRLGSCFGLKHIKIKKPLQNPILEKAFKKHGSKWTYRGIMSLAKQTASSERQIERWLRLRKIYDKPSPLQRFSDSCWHCFFCLNIFLYGLITLWSKPWFWDLDYCWVNYPNQGSVANVWSFYILSLSFYWSLIVAQIFRPGQKYFSTLLYNISVVILLSFTWICNLYRIGAIILLIHNFTNISFCAFKALKYIKQFKLSTVLYVVFLITWTITRLVYYPFWILYSTIYRAPIVADKMLTSYYIFKCLLVSLFLINLYWLYSVLKAIDKNQRSVAKNRALSS